MGMRKILKYIINFTLFCLIWYLVVVLLMAIGVGLRFSQRAWPAISGIASIFISYLSVKRINNSNLWSRLFSLKEVSSDESGSSNTIEQKNQVDSTSKEIADELAKLNRLKQEGVLTEEEFESQKKKLLS